MTDAPVQELTIPDAWRVPPLALVAAGTITHPERTDGTGEHWLTFDRATRAVVGCSCGFRAEESDDGWGDSVVAHLLDAGAQAARTRTEPPIPARAPMRPRTSSPDNLWGKP